MKARLWARALVSGKPPSIVSSIYGPAWPMHADGWWPEQLAPSNHKEEREYRDEERDWFGECHVAFSSLFLLKNLILKNPLTLKFTISTPWYLKIFLEIVLWSVFKFSWHSSPSHNYILTPSFSKIPSWTQLLYHFTLDNLEVFISWLEIRCNLIKQNQNE